MIEHFSLSDVIAQKLRVALQGDEEYFKQAIKNRVCQLWEFMPGTFVITRLEVDEKTNNKTLVICCFQGEKVCLFTENIISFCVENKIEFIRFHTRVKKLGRVMNKKFLFNNVAEIGKESIYLLEV